MRVTYQRHPKHGGYRLVECDTQLDLARAYCALDNQHSRVEDWGWVGATKAECDNAMRYGNRKYVNASDKFSKMLKAPDMQIKTRQRVSSMTGPRFNYSAAMQGRVRCCERQERVRDDLAPITVVYDVAVSGGQSAASIERRGAATLALVRELSAVRQVNLWIVCGLRTIGETVITATQLTSDPLDVARASWVMCCPAYLRSVMFAISTDAAQKGSDGDGHVQWAFGKHEWQQKELPAYAATMVGAKGDDALVVPGLHLSDGPFDSDADAVTWVQRQLTELSGKEVA